MEKNNIPHVANGGAIVEKEVWGTGSMNSTKLGYDTSSEERIIDNQSWLKLYKLAVAFRDLHPWEMRQLNEQSF